MSKTRDAIESSVRYLQSTEARDALSADPYWPKWDSPWWHMLLLHELGETQAIPESIIEPYVAALNRIPVKFFPLRQDELPEGIDPYRHTPCHCQLGNVYQVLHARGLDVDDVLPWIRPWFLKYQMPDGGFNCDNDAYLVKDETPSSMVGTIAVFEAVLNCTSRPWTPDEQEFLRKGADFLIGRKLHLGSPTRHNASEQESAKGWRELCFPRFYLYDVLRGLVALLTWSEKTQNPIPREAVSEVARDLEARFPDGAVRLGRQSFADAGTLLRSENGEWLRRQPATSFPLLRATSQIGDVSPTLTAHWSMARARLRGLGFLE